MKVGFFESDVNKKSTARFNVPMFITIAGAVPPVLFFIFVVFKLYILALFMFLGALLDVVDGFVARKQNKVTAFGGFLDATLDRVSDFFFIAAFAAGNIVSWGITVTLLLLSFLISYTKSRGELESKGTVSFKVGLVERPFRLAVVFLALLLYMLFPEMRVGENNIAQAIFLVLILLSGLTVAQRVLHAWRKL